MRISHDMLCGRTVISADGLAVGEIETLFLDSDTWGIEALHIKLRKDVADRLGADRTMFHAGTVEIPIRMVQSVGDAVVLSAPIDQLRQVVAGANDPTAAPAPG